MMKTEFEHGSAEGAPPTSDAYGNLNNNKDLAVPRVERAPLVMMSVPSAMVIPAACAIFMAAALLSAVARP